MEKFKEKTVMEEIPETFPANGHHLNSSKSKNTFKILSIDGGGIKGLYPARILKIIEERYQVRIADHFDLICGTSTGGLIALGLSIGKPASEIVCLYHDKGPIIFPQPKNWWAKKLQELRHFLGSGKYSQEPLEEILKEFFGDLTLQDASTLLCIPSYNLTLGMPRVFKNPHGQFFKDGDISMVDAALATSAAPTYLPIHQINNALYCDGGMWANNPALCGLLEALEYFVGEGKEFDSYSILSLPTISTPTGWSGNYDQRNKSIKDWGGKILHPPMEGQSYFTDFFLKKIVNHTIAPGFYHRVQTPNLSAEQISIISLDNTSEKALKLLTEFGDQTAAELISKGTLNSFLTPIKQGGFSNGKL